LPQHIERDISVDQLTALSLGEARLYLCCYCGTLFDHPIFELELLTDYFERLIQDLVRVLIRAGSDGQIDHALLFRF
jgi:hypothetical protein